MRRKGFLDIVETSLTRENSTAEQVRPAVAPAGLARGPLACSLPARVRLSSLLWPAALPLRRCGPHDQ